MIRRINWSDSDKNPFVQSSNEPLKITLHTESFVSLSDEETEAIEQIKRLARRQYSSLKLLDTALSSLPHLEIGIANEAYIPVQIQEDGNVILLTRVKPNMQQWLEIASSITSKSINDPSVIHLAQQLVIAHAHKTVDYDIFITASSSLLEHRNSTWIDKTNIRTPLEAAEIIGLYLRSRNIYHLWTSKKLEPFDREYFYLVMTKHRLPSMWSYEAKCSAKDEDTGYLGYSIILRFMRVLRARDCIGQQFYLQKNYSSLQTMSYHFDYLTLLLSGVFDIMAHVAYLSWNNPKYNRKQMNFRSHPKVSDFIKELKQHDSPLYNIVVAPQFQNFLMLLYELRNNIHATMPSYHVKDNNQSVETYIDVLPNQRTTLLQAAKSYSSLEDWGLIEQYYNIVIDTSTFPALTEPRMEVHLEPYTYANALVKESLKWIDQIAQVTNLSGFLVGSKVLSSQIPSSLPPNDPIFNDEIGRHAAYLAGL